MEASDLYKLLTGDQKAASAKIQMIAGDMIEQCSSVDEVAKCVTYVLERVRQQGINKILGMKNQFVEIIEQEEEKPEDAVETTKSD